MICWVVLDSNIYVSALVFGGNPRAILELAEERLFEVSVSDAIKADVERVLGLKFSWPKERISDATAYLWTLAHAISPQQTVSDCTDPDDNRVLECALEAHAQAIITGDNHLLKLHPYREISILTPKQFLEAKPWQS
jgi:putative PIN family toxin of toxin-antitoxin system